MYLTCLIVCLIGFPSLETLDFRREWIFFFKRMTTLVLEYLKPVVLFNFIVYVLFKCQCVILEMDKK